MMQPYFTVESTHDHTYYVTNSQIYEPDVYAQKNIVLLQLYEVCGNSISVESRTR